MGYAYDQRKRPPGRQKPAPEPAAAPGPDLNALAQGMAKPSAAQKGRPIDLDAAMKAKMEHAFGDLSAVKLYESQAVGQAGAEALAMGNEIAFAPGMADFSTKTGQERLGHELSHVMSQRSGAVRGQGFLASTSLEARADREGAMAAAGQQVYTGPVTSALSGASPSPSVAGPMQARRQDGDDGQQQATINAPLADLHGPQIAPFDPNSLPQPVRQEPTISAPLPEMHGPRIEPFDWSRLPSNRVAKIMEPTADLKGPRVPPAPRDLDIPSSGTSANNLRHFQNGQMITRLDQDKPRLILDDDNDLPGSRKSISMAPDPSPGLFNTDKGHVKTPQEKKLDQMIRYAAGMKSHQQAGALAGLKRAQRTKQLTKEYTDKGMDPKAAKKKAQEEANKLEKTPPRKNFYSEKDEDVLNEYYQYGGVEDYKELVNRKYKMQLRLYDYRKQLDEAHPEKSNAERTMMAMQSDAGRDYLLMETMLGDFGASNDNPDFNEYLQTEGAGDETKKYTPEEQEKLAFVTTMGQYQADPEVAEYWESDAGRQQEMASDARDVEYYQSIYKGKKPPPRPEPRSKYAADFDLLNSQKGSDQERKRAYNNIAIPTVQNMTDQQRNAIKDYIAGSEEINNYLRDQKQSPDYPKPKDIPRVQQQAEDISAGIQRNPLQENVSAYKGITDKYLALMFQQHGLTKAINKNGSINHEWLRKNQSKMRKALIGKTFFDKAYTSTSTEKAYAQEWARQKSAGEIITRMEEEDDEGINEFSDMVRLHPEKTPGAHLVRMKLPKGANASFVDRASPPNFQGIENEQREVLVDKGSTFKISDIQKAKDSDTYELVMDLLAEEEGKKKKKK